MALDQTIKKELVYELALFFVSIGSIAFFYTENPLLTAILIVSLMIGGKLWYKKNDVYYFVAGAIIGPFAEIVCIRFGAWSYTNPNILGIPVWLTIAWGIATVLIMRIAETFLKIKKK